MSKILLLLEHRENRRLLALWLQKSHEVFYFDSDEKVLSTSLDFDLCILDGMALDKFNNWVITTKRNNEPVFLPCLLMTSRPDVNIITRHLWKSIDELIISPIEKLELQARVEMLLQRRKLSLKLQLANQNLLQLNDLKTNFISMASHELRNPLNLISGYAQLLIQGKKDLAEDNKKNIYRRIINAIETMTSTLNDVLLLTRGELAQKKFNPKPLNLNLFCLGLISNIQLGVGNNHQLNLSISEEEITVNADRQLLESILTNLLINAIKYSPQSSAIAIELTARENQIIFKIEDSGIGIPLEDQQQLFTSFHRAGNVGSIPGSGLGLAIVKQSVELHGGTIDFDSEVDRGTTFIVTIPRSTPIIVDG
jgi:signal transduction histidine kinase